LSVLTPAQAQDVCYEAGFRFNRGIIIMPAIGWAESRLRTDARHMNPDGSIDRGWLQINTVHRDISDADCDDPLKAAVYAYNNLAKKGTSFSAWAAYLSGAYKGPEGLTLALFTALWTAKSTGLQLTDALAIVEPLEAKIAAAKAALA
jgi:Lysozyme like domain